MTQKTINGIKYITADTGKVFRRIGTNDVYGNSIALGYSHYINGVKLAKPHKDEPEDFEEIDSINELDI